MKRITILLVIMFFSVENSAQIIPAEDRNKILETLEAQRTAWNNGDLIGYMHGYRQSDSLRFIGKNEITYGWNRILSRYQKSYPAKETMGNLTFKVISIESLNRTSVFMIGKWELAKKEKNISGLFSLIWKEIKGKWLVVVDHTS